MSKPSWDAAPELEQFLAKKADSSWVALTPFEDQHTGGSCMTKRIPRQNWRKALEPKPTPEATDGR